MIKLELTEHQAQQLAEVMDIAVKATGIQGAKTIVPLMDALMAAVEASKDEQTNSLD